MEIGHRTYDQNLKGHMTRPRGAHSNGPFYQLVAYQFGNFRMLVRYTKTEKKTYIFSFTRQKEKFGENYFIRSDMIKAF